MRPSAYIYRFRQLAKIFGHHYRGAHAQPIEGGYIFEVRLRKNKHITVFWEVRK